MRQEFKRYWSVNTDPDLKQKALDVKRRVCISDFAEQPKLVLQYKAAVEGAQYEQKTFEPMNASLP